MGHLFSIIKSYQIFSPKLEANTQIIPVLRSPKKFTFDNIKSVGKKPLRIVYLDKINGSPINVGLSLIIEDNKYTVPIPVTPRAKANPI